LCDTLFYSFQEKELQKHDKFLDDQWEEEKAAKEAEEKEDDEDVDSIVTDGSIGRRADLAREALQDCADDDVDVLRMAPLGGVSDDDDDELEVRGAVPIGFDSTDLTVQFSVRGNKKRNPLNNTSPNKGLEKKKTKFDKG
jgi:hypothetical protein